MTFQEHLAELRQAHGLSQKEVAKAVDISLPSYQRYEYGTREPSLSTLIAFADLYGLTLDELVCRDPNKPREINF